jgi:phosphoribosylanthranilate isomerase
VAQALKIAAVIPPFVSVVALFVDEPADIVRRIVETVPVDTIQFHGNETAPFCQQFGRPWIKALRMKPGTDVASFCRDYRSARGILLDSWQEGVPGGTGRTFDGQLAAHRLPLPVIAAGGLDDGNVAAAMAVLRPAAVDVSGGVERSPGRKDPAKVRAFIAAVRAADDSLNGIANDN